MLQFTKKAKELQEMRAKKKIKTIPEIVVIRTIRTEEKDKEGNIIIKFKKERTNLTRKINETAKVLKNENAQNNLEKIKEIFQA